MPVAAGDTAYVNDIQTSLNRALQRAARASGVVYVDTYTASKGHDACQPVGKRWVEPVLGSATEEPAHPNELGEQAIARLVRQALHLP